jgi:hypothetical protein
MRTPALVPALVLLLSACTASTPQPATADAVAADSLVLERTPCFGVCPTYRLSVDRAGAVVFEGSGRSESAGRQTATVPPGTLDTLVARATRIGFFQLPELVREDSTLCARRATDHPSIVLSVFRPEGATRVDYYTGCYARAEEQRRMPVLDSLGALAAAIDSAAGVARWLEPGRRP